MSAPAAAHLVGLRILIAEDEYLIARDLELTLVDAGCAEVFVVPSIAECRRVAAETKLHAAVLDLCLRDGDASGLAGELRAQGIALVIVTGYEEMAAPTDLRDLPRLAKPFPRRELIDVLRASLPTTPPNSALPE